MLPPPMSPLPAPVQAILELFQGPLAEVRFADVDAAVLANAAHSVEAAVAAVVEVEAQLAELKQALADKQEALLVLTQRALAYARVYAENDEALSEQLAGIVLSRASKPRKAPVKATNLDSSAPPRDAVTDEKLITRVGDETADATTSPEALESDTQAAAASDSEAPEPAPSASRKGKRRAGAAREEAQDGPA